MSLFAIIARTICYHQLYFIAEVLNLRKASASKKTKLFCFKTCKTQLKFWGELYFAFFLIVYFY